MKVIDATYHENLSKYAQDSLAVFMITGRDFYSKLGDAMAIGNVSVNELVETAQLFSRENRESGDDKLAGKRARELKQISLNNSVRSVRKDFKYSSHILESSVNGLTIPMVTSDNSKLVQYGNRHVSISNYDAIKSKIDAATPVSKFSTLKVGKRGPVQVETNQCQDIVKRVYALVEKEMKVQAKAFSSEIEKTTTQIMATMLVMRAIDLGDVKQERNVDEALVLDFCKHLNACKSQGTANLSTMSQQGFGVAEKLITTLGYSKEDICNRCWRLGTPLQEHPDNIFDALTGAKEAQTSLETLFPVVEKEEVVILEETAHLISEDENIHDEEPVIIEEIAVIDDAIEVQDEENIILPRVIELPGKVEEPVEEAVEDASVNVLPGKTQDDEIEVVPEEDLKALASAIVELYDRVNSLDETYYESYKKICEQKGLEPQQRVKGELENPITSEEVKTLSDMGACAAMLTTLTSAVEVVDVGFEELENWVDTGKFAKIIRPENKNDETDYEEQAKNMSDFEKMQLMIELYDALNGAVEDIEKRSEALTNKLDNKQVVDGYESESLNLVSKDKENTQLNAIISQPALQGGGRKPKTELTRNEIEGILTNMMTDAVIDLRDNRENTNLNQETQTKLVEYLDGAKAALEGDESKDGDPNTRINGVDRAKEIQKEYFDVSQNIFNEFGDGNSIPFDNLFEPEEKRGPKAAVKKFLQKFYKKLGLKGPTGFKRAIKSRFKERFIEIFKIKKKDLKLTRNTKIDERN